MQQGRPMFHPWFDSEAAWSISMEVKEMEAVSRSVILFIVAGLCEIGGRWLVWQWLRDPSISRDNPQWGGG
jgi:hypothetical protein